MKGDFETSVDHKCIRRHNLSRSVFLFLYGIFPLKSELGCLAMAHTPSEVTLDVNLALFRLPLVKVLHFNLSDMQCDILLVFADRDLLLSVLELQAIVTLEAHWGKLHDALEDNVHEFNVHCWVKEHVYGLDLCLIIIVAIIITLTSEKFLEQA